MLFKGIFQQLSVSWSAILFLFIAIIVISVLRFRIVKGWIGEKVTAAGMWLGLDGNVYRRTDDVIIPVSDGTTQIDHVLVSKYGIFVIETKNMKGWIFGSSHDEKWTQSIYGKKSQFQNPLRQNYRHVKCLTEFLDIEEGKIKPVVFFIGDCEFKTPMPSNVLNSGLIPYIKGFKQECLTEEQVSEIEGKLITLKQDKSLNREAHIDSLRRVMK